MQLVPRDLHITGLTNRPLHARDVRLYARENRPSVTMSVSNNSQIVNPQLVKIGVA